ncbi:hypothetical protein [Peredibacter starrii]|uniref:IrrE N-terminal-like domain-containing protein n=1 Tax=Peredibacter starrii TaxID=28202 RepID=A0AAX4HJZ4_9BACT|nr:hypothetical protein [Peredibacter starrii]WPU63552.1 hypothetical protein SOO65_12720 [Peredibacter starrii]
MNESLITATEIPNGFTWTLASRLGDMLTYAEEMFGPRNKDFTILGIEYCESGPRIWYPKSKKNIVIQLSDSAKTSEVLALYQLAHESIHLLSPSGSMTANVLEEGLAVYFSWWYVEKALGLEGKSITNSESYKLAGLLVERLLRLNPDFFLEARGICPRPWEITENQILKLCPEIDSRDVAILTMPFEKFQKLSIKSNSIDVHL